MLQLANPKVIANETRGTSRRVIYIGPLGGLAKPPTKNMHLDSLSEAFGDALLLAVLRSLYRITC